MSRALKFVLGLSLSVILASCGFVGGFVVGNGRSVTGAPKQDAELNEKLDEVRGLLNAQALTPPSETSATAGAIQGLLMSSGDKYGTYFDAERFDYFSQDSMGEFGGIGVVLSERDGSVYVVEVYDGTPAAKVGIKKDDIFLTIDGERRDNWTSDEVVKRVRGEEGTDVKLTMFRPDKAEAAVEGHPGGPTEGTEVSFTVTRAVIELPNIESELMGEVGYIRVAQFNAKTADDLTTVIEDLTKEGATSLVLDLRDNPGGLLDQAVDVTSLFVDGGVVVRIEERGKDETVLRSNGGKITDLPLVTLVNGNSASASEIVAGALQDHGRATIVGEKSFGKGSVQTIEELSFGGAVKFTTAHYLTPKSRVIDGKGVMPDQEVKMDVELQADPKTDTQLAKALEIAGASK